eukprot:502485-Hanusia_phi.AAC.3
MSNLCEADGEDGGRGGERRRGVVGVHLDSSLGRQYDKLTTSSIVLPSPNQPSSLLLPPSSPSSSSMALQLLLSTRSPPVPFSRSDIQYGDRVIIGGGGEQCHAEVAVQDGVSGVDFKRSSEVILCQLPAAQLGSRKGERRPETSPA